MFPEASLMSDATTNAAVTYENYLKLDQLLSLKQLARKVRSRRNAVHGNFQVTSWVQGAAPSRPRSRGCCETMSHTARTHFKLILTILKCGPPIDLIETMTRWFRRFARGTRAAIGSTTVPANRVRDRSQARRASRAFSCSRAHGSSSVGFGATLWTRFLHYSGESVIPCQRHS